MMSPLLKVAIAFICNFKRIKLAKTAFFFFVFSMLSHTVFSQVINWQFLPEGQVNGNCVSESSFENGTACYGLEYTPGVTGLMSSYTMGFFIDCIPEHGLPIEAKSTVLSDNTQIFNVCEPDGIIFLQASGQDQSPFSAVPVVANEPLIIHQVCFDFHFLDTVDIVLDNFTGISMSIVDENNVPITDSPPFGDTEVDYSGFDLRPCDEGVICETSFDINKQQLQIDSVSANGIVVASQSLSENTSFQQFDVFDEINKFCGIEGGDQDVNINIHALRTFDVYGNGVLNDFIDDEGKVFQDTNGISSDIAFGLTPNSASSVGDVRGYELTVTFEDHLRVEAEQMNVLLRNPNSSNIIFESASIEFLSPSGLPYGKATYQGFYDGCPDLSGACLASPLGTPYQITGNGVYVMANQDRVDVTMPCNPVANMAGVDSLVVNASLQAGLHPKDLIGGFVLRVLGEDIALPTSADDGSGVGGEDLIAGNNATNTVTSLKTSLIGFGFDGCVFKEPNRKVLDIAYSASPEFVSIGDTIRYTLDVYNRGVERLDSIDLTINIPQEIINITSSPDLIVDGNVVTFDSLPLGRLDSISMFIKGVIAPSTPSTSEIIDIVDVNTHFKDSSEHHLFDGWFASTNQPRSGVMHWQVDSDTATSVKTLIIENNFIPTDSTKLIFYHAFNTELHKDGGYVEISQDNGNSWMKLDTHFIENPYNDYLNSDPLLEGFSGNQPTYIRSAADLSSLKDKSILIRFIFITDCENAVGSWYVDDVSLTNLKYGLPSNALAVMDSLNDMDNIYPLTQIVACSDVYTMADSGEGSLRRAIACADPVDFIQFMPSVHDSVIMLQSSIEINKNITINESESNTRISQFTSESIFNIGNTGVLTLEDIILHHVGQDQSSTLINNNILNLTNTTINGKSGVMGNHILNLGALNVNGTNLLIKEQ